MKRDQPIGWRSIEHIDVGVLKGLHPAIVSAGRWLSPIGKEATIVSSRSLHRGTEPVPRAVSCPTVAKDAQFSVGQFVVDPQLVWHDLDGRFYLVSPALGMRLSVRASESRIGRGLARLRSRPCLALIEKLETAAASWSPPSTAVGESLAGTHPAILTRWPMPLTSAPEQVIAPATRPARIATRPAAFYRDEADDPVPV